MIKENGKPVKCPLCGSTDVIRVHPFDYVKQCENPKCPEWVRTRYRYKHQWSTGVHN